MIAQSGFIVYYWWRRTKNTRMCNIKRAVMMMNTKKKEWRDQTEIIYDYHCMRSLWHICCSIIILNVLYWINALVWFVSVGVEDLMYTPSIWTLVICDTIISLQMRYGKKETSSSNNIIALLTISDRSALLKYRL